MNPSFAQAFIATRYLLGARGDELDLGVIEGSRLPPGSSTGEFAERLKSPDRSVRSQALAQVLRDLVVELEQRRIG